MESKRQNCRSVKLTQDKFEHQIIESIQDNLVTIICGETGSGKSTRVPQFLYDHGLVSSAQTAKVAITQPRRIAAVSLAKRVSDEMNLTYKPSQLESGGEIASGDQMVGYQVRWQHSRNYLKCGIKFVTDGILLNEMMSDPFLGNYEYVIIDEAHERKMVSDVLVGLVVKAGNWVTGRVICSSISGEAVFVGNGKGPAEGAPVETSETDHHVGDSQCEGTLVECAIVPGSGKCDQYQNQNIPGECVLQQGVSG